MLFLLPLFYFKVDGYKMPVPHVYTASSHKAHHIQKSQMEEKGYIKCKILVIFRNVREQISIGLENTTQIWSTVQSYFSLVTKMDILLIMSTEMIFIGHIYFDIANSGLSLVPIIWESWLSMNSSDVLLPTPLYEHCPFLYSPTLP